MPRTAGTRLRARFPLMLLVTAFGALSGLPTPAPGQIYHPLAVGSHWEYNSVRDGDQTMTITGERVVRGHITRVRRQEEATQIYQNFWTQDDAGNLYLHGAENLTSGWGAAYEPPVQMVASPLYLGRAWVTENIHVYELDGASYGGGPFDYPCRVYTEGTMIVPAGEFYAYGVGNDIGPVPLLARDGMTFDVLGRRVEPGQTRTDNATEWYAVNVGEVLTTYLEDESLGFRLVSYNPPTPLRESSWGRIRYLFRH